MVWIRLRHSNYRPYTKVAPIVRTSGSRHTGLAAPPQRNMQAKIVETQMMIESLRYAISKLNDEERDIIERLYFNDETLRSVAKLKSITHPALIKRRNKILEKLKKFI